MISLHLGEKLLSEVQAERFRMKNVHAELVEAMVGQDDFGETLVNARPNLLDYIPAEGVAVWWEGKVTRHGSTPTDEQLGLLVEWLNTSVPEGVFLTECLASQFAPARNYTGVASGLLALSVSRTPRDYVLWFRPEASRTVTWAGNPAKPVDVTGDGLRISPRKSFAAWKEIVREHSQPWGEPVADAAQALRLSILDVVLRHQDKVMREREEARRHQDFLMAELDHRVKNTLATIQALIKYTSGGAASLEEFAQKVQERVYAMARTHSQLTHSRWEGVNLHTVVAEQFAPFGERVSAAGPNLALRPKAALSISLALHELMTNAAKYGALSVASGRVAISWQVKSGDGGRGLHVRWEEHGGRRSRDQSTWGSDACCWSAVSLTISKAKSRSISGLKAWPARPSFLLNISSNSREKMSSVAGASKPTLSLRGQRILIVEDQFLIAMELQQSLERAGATIVGPVGRLDRALSIVEDNGLNAALLDVDLNGERCWPVADLLSRAGVPFAFTTGFSANIVMPERFVGRPVLAKPYREGEICPPYASY